jgi:hypothetical protein
MEEDTKAVKIQTEGDDESNGESRRRNRMYPYIALENIAARSPEAEANKFL